MRVVFQAGSLGKDHWEIFVIFFFLHQALNSFQHLCFSFLSLGNPPAHLRHQHLFSLQVLSECLASVPAGPKGPWLCHWGFQTRVSATLLRGLAAKTSIITDSCPKELYCPSLPSRLPCQFWLPFLLHLCPNCYFLQTRSTYLWLILSCYHWFCLPMPHTPSPGFGNSFNHSRNNYWIPTMIHTLS